MRAIILDGSKKADEIKRELSDKIKLLKHSIGSVPRLIALQIGEGGAFSVYANSQKKIADTINMDYELIKLAACISEQDLIEKIIQQEGFRASPKPHKRKTSYYWEEQVVNGARVSKRLGVPQDKLHQIQEQIRLLLGRSTNASFEKEYNSVRGRIAWAGSLDERMGQKLMRQLNSAVQ